MGKNKLFKFDVIDKLDFVFQYPYAVLKNEGFPLKGKWHSDFFGNDNPITLELGCGKGEYTVGLARRFPDRNFIGVDIKGARMYTGATQAAREGLKNVAFVRTSIELLDNFFAPGEVAEVWITFPDPQMQKQRKRLTSARFLDLYRRFCADGARINLKCDSPFLYTYTRRLCAANPEVLPVVADTADLYSTPGIDSALTDIRTHYEQQWLDRGLTIKYLSWLLNAGGDIAEVDDSDIDRDTYRSYSRGQIEMPQLFRMENEKLKMEN